MLWRRWIVLKKALVVALEVLEKPLVTRWESVGIYLLNGKALVYVFLWEVTSVKFLPWRDNEADDLGIVSSLEWMTKGYSVAMNLTLSDLLNTNLMFHLFANAQHHSCLK